MARSFSRTSAWVQGGNAQFGPLNRTREAFPFSMTSKASTFQLQDASEPLVERALAVDIESSTKSSTEFMMFSKTLSRPCMPLDSRLSELTHLYTVAKFVAFHNRSEFV